MTTALLLLRATQAGLTLHDALMLEVGEILDILIEKSNDGYEYPTRGNQDDFARLFGG